jgi:4-amino-4-deoxy-L-arabinose transferase-like glycosyltransferase
MSGTSSSSPDGRSIPRYRWLTALFILLFTAFRFWYSGHVELVQDESYYWQWSRHLAFGYYDNTPLMAFVIHFFTAPWLFGSTETGVRAGALASSVVVSLFIYLLAAELLDERTAMISVVVANIIPLYSAGAILMTQDPVHVALWSATLYFAWLALKQQHGAKLWTLWLLTGLLAGLTIMAKLNGSMILPGIFLYVCIVPGARRWLKHPAPYIAAAIALAMIVPFILWNHSHENAFWLHSQAMGTRGADKAKTLRWTGEFLGAQALLLSPFVFFTYLFALRFPKMSAEPDVDSRPLTYLWSTSMIVFAVIILQTLRGRVEGNWAVSAYVSGIILVGWLMGRSTGKVRIWHFVSVALAPSEGVIVVTIAYVRIWHFVSVALALLLTFIVYFPTIGYGLGLRMKSDRTTELHGWRALAQRVSTEQAFVGGPSKSFVFGVNYRMPSEMAFYLPGQPTTYSLFLHDRRNEYMFWNDPNKLIGENAIFVNDSDTPDHLEDCRAVFQRVDLEPPFEYYRKPYTKPVRVVQIFRCYGFKGYDPKTWEQGW